MKNLKNFKDQFGRKYKIDINSILVEWRISVYGVVFNKNKKVMMLMPHFNDKWQFPGGSIEIGETIDEALKREFLEEVGYKIKSDLTKLIYLSEGNFYDSYEKKFFRSIQLTFKTTLIDQKQYKKMILRDEGMDYGVVSWIDPADLNKDNVHYIHWPIVQKLQK